MHICPLGAIVMHQKQANRVSSRVCEQTGSPSQEPNTDRHRLAAALPIASEPAAYRLHPGLSISPGSVSHLPFFSSSPCWRGSKPPPGVHHSVFVPLPPLSLSSSSSSALFLSPPRLEPPLMKDALWHTPSPSCSDASRIAGFSSPNLIRHLYSADRWVPHRCSRGNSEGSLLGMERRPESIDRPDMYSYVRVTMGCRFFAATERILRRRWRE